MVRVLLEDVTASEVLLEHTLALNGEGGETIWWDCSLSPGALQSFRVTLRVSGLASTPGAVPLTPSGLLLLTLLPLALRRRRWAPG